MKVSNCFQEKKSQENHQDQHYRQIGCTHKHQKIATHIQYFTKKFLKRNITHAKMLLAKTSKQNCKREFKGFKKLPKRVWKNKLVKSLLGKKSQGKFPGKKSQENHQDQHYRQIGCTHKHQKIATHIQYFTKKFLKRNITHAKMLLAKTSKQNCKREFKGFKKLPKRVWKNKLVKSLLIFCVNSTTRKKMGFNCLRISLAEHEY